MSPTSWHWTIWFPIVHFDNNTDHSRGPAMKEIKSLNSFSFFLCVVWSLGDIHRCVKDLIMFTKRQFPLRDSILERAQPVGHVSLPNYGLLHFFPPSLCKIGPMNVPLQDNAYFYFNVILLYKTIAAKNLYVSNPIWLSLSFLVLNPVLVSWPFCLK